MGRSRQRSCELTVRDLGAQVVEDVSLGNSVEEVRSDEAEGVPVDGAKGTTLEVPLSVTVVGEGGVGVLEEGDHDQVVVDDQVRDEVEGDNLSDSSVVGPGSEGGESESDSGVGDEDVPSVTGVED